MTLHSPTPPPEPFSATMVIWGEATGTLIRTKFLNLREPDFATAEAMSEESERTVRGSHPDAYADFNLSFK